MTRERATSEIARSLAQFSADRALLDERCADLLKRHPWCYVGVYRGDIFVGFTFEEVIRHFGDGDHVVIKHLNPNPPAYILAVA